MIKGIWADLILAAYILITLYFRFQAEPYLEDRPLMSLVLGLVMLAFLWALIKVKILDPNYFGLMKKKDLKEE